MEEKKRPGRPQQYSEPKVNETHRMTQKAHQYIRAHKEKIETAAQKWIQNKL